MEQFPKDITLYILSYLSDKNKLIFLSINHFWNEFKKNIKFIKFYNYQKIVNLSYIDNFEAIYNYEPQQYLPKNIKKIKLSSNKQIIECFPEQIESIEFEKPYHHILDGKLPSKLKILKLYHSSLENIKCALPNGLEHLEFGTYDWIDLDFFPESLKVLNMKFQHLIFPKKVRLPINLEKLKVKFKTNKPNDVWNLPNNLKELDYNGRINKPLPIGLDSFTIYLHSIDENIKEYLPSKLKILRLVDYIDFYDRHKWQTTYLQNVLDNLPIGLKYIEVVITKYSVTIPNLIDECDIPNFIKIDETKFPFPKFKNGLNCLYFMRETEV